MINNENGINNGSRENALDLLNSGVNELFKKNYDSSIQLIEKANKIFTDLNDVTNMAVCFAELAIVQYKKSSLNLSNSYLLLNKAGDILKDVPHSSEIDAKIAHYYGKLYFYEKHFTEALIFYAKALKQTGNDRIEQARIFDSIAIFYLRLNNHQVSLSYLHKSLNIKRKIKNKAELGFTELLFGRFLLSIEDYDNAAKHLNKALALNEEIGFESLNARILEELAKIHIYTEDYKNAELFCQKAITVSEGANSKLLSAFSQSTLAYLMTMKDENEKALDLINKVSSVFQELNVPRGQAFLYQTEGIIFFNKGDQEKAAEKLDNAVEIFIKLGIYKEIVRCYFYLAQIHKQKQDIQTSLGYTLEAMKIAKTNNYAVLTVKIEALLFNLVDTNLADIKEVVVNKEEALPNGSPLFNKMSLFEDISTCKKPQDPLVSLLKIGKAIYSEIDPDKILDIATKETQNAMNADRCSIFMYDNNTHELYSRIASGMENQEIRFPSNAGMAGHVFTVGEIIKIDDAYINPMFNKEIDYKTGYKTKTILCIPMRNSNQDIIGVFEVINKHNNAVFTDKDLELLVSISSSVGASLENANLLKKQLLMYKDQKKSFISFINALAASIDARDKITAGHSTRVTTYALAIADQLGWNKEDREVLEYSALLHDIGKLGIRDEVLCKEGKLTEEEYMHIREHSSITYEILDKMYFEEKFKMVPEIAASHHEKYNGKGYHKGLSGDDIPIGGRILAVADVFDAITSKRHYRDRMPFKQVLNILKNDSGSHFDGKIVDEFFKINIAKIADILSSRYKDPISPEELIILSESTINDLYLILNKDEADLAVDEKALLSTFLRHYIGE